MALSMTSQIGAAACLIFACYFFWLQRFSRYSGAFPALYVGMEYGMTEQDIPNLAGKTFLITGGSSGLGKATAELLHAANANVIITCRKESNCDGALEAITIRGEQNMSEGHVRSIFVDLASLLSIKNATEHLKDVELDGVVLSAGLAGVPFKLTSDGIESMFAVNHVAHFYLMQLISHQLKPKARVVVVSSSAHLLATSVPTDLRILNHRLSFRTKHWYAFSKMANVLFAQELSERLAPRQIAVNAVHPGAVRTNIVRTVAQPVIPGDIGAWHAKTISALASSLMWSPQIAALSLIYAAASPEIETKHLTGQYLVPIARLGQASRSCRNETLQKELWDFTSELIEFKLQEATGGWRYAKETDTLYPGNKQHK